MIILAAATSLSSYIIKFFEDPLDDFNEKTTWKPWKNSEHPKRELNDTTMTSAVSIPILTLKEPFLEHPNWSRQYSRLQYYKKQAGYAIHLVMFCGIFWLHAWLSFGVAEFSKVLDLMPLYENASDQPWTYRMMHKWAPVQWPDIIWSHRTSITRKKSIYSIFCCLPPWTSNVFLSFFRSVGRYHGVVPSKLCQIMLHNT